MALNLNFRAHMLAEIYSETIARDTAKDRKALQALAKHTDMGSRVPLVYIYSLAASSQDIPYPRRGGRVVYIGETQRETGSGKRFGHHVSSSLTEGLSTLINHTLSVYYHSGVALRLQIFRVTDGRTTKDAERVLLNCHLLHYGAYPMGQGTSGGDNTPRQVAQRYEKDRELWDECSLLLMNTP